MVIINLSCSLFTITNISKLSIHGEHIFSSEQTWHESRETFLKIVRFPSLISQYSFPVIFIRMLFLWLHETVEFNSHGELDTMDFGSSIVFISMTEAKISSRRYSTLPLMKIRWIISFRLSFCPSSFQLPYATKPIQIHPKRTVEILVHNDTDGFWWHILVFSKLLIYSWCYNSHAPKNQRLTQIHNGQIYIKCSLKCNFRLLYELSGSA